MPNQKNTGKFHLCRISLIIKLRINTFNQFRSPRSLSASVAIWLSSFFHYWDLLQSSLSPPASGNDRDLTLFSYILYTPLKRAPCSIKAMTTGEPESLVLLPVRPAGQTDPYLTVHLIDEDDNRCLRIRHTSISLRVCVSTPSHRLLQW